MQRSRFTIDYTIEEPITAGTPTPFHIEFAFSKQTVVANADLVLTAVVSSDDFKIAKSSDVHRFTVHMGKHSVRYEATLLFQTSGKGCVSVHVLQGPDVVDKTEFDLEVS